MRTKVKRQTRQQNDTPRSVAVSSILAVCLLLRVSRISGFSTMSSRQRLRSCRWLTARRPGSTSLSSSSENLDKDDNQLVVDAVDDATDYPMSTPEPTYAEYSPPARQQPQRRTIPTSELLAAMGTSPRRLFLGTASATGIALAGNFLGVTSRLLTLVPEDTVEATGLDTYFPRGDFKRVRQNGYAFVIPKEWVGDTFLALAKAQRATQPLDYGMKRGSGATTLPDSAFGPPGRLNPTTGVSEQGDTNVSVIVSGGFKGFSLRGTLGTPTQAAEKLLQVSLAPPGSGRTATLREAFEDTDRQGIYQMEYDVERGNPNLPLLRAISVIAAGRNGSSLITMTVTAPLSTWETDPEMNAKLRRIASSFHLQST